jgi:hypothetical protein
MLRELYRNPYTRWGSVFLILIVANIVNHIYWNWGLITVKVNDVPLAKVVKSIEWQGWVKICTNVPLDTKISMYVDHVPLAEAMETLSVNISVPPPDPSTTGGAGQGPGGSGLARGAPGAGPGNPPGGTSPDGQGRGGRGGGGFERSAQWNLAFFVAPTSAQVKAEISDFQNGLSSDDTKVFNFPTPLQMAGTGDEMSAADPRQQSWPGVQALPAPPAPAPPAENSQTTSAPPASGTPDPASDGPPTVQTYLQDLAQAANIWILAPSAWTPQVSQPPPANSSIISAVKSLIGSAHGAVTEVIVLRLGRGGRGGGGRGGFANMESMAVRMDNAINGLPEDERAPARDQLNQQVAFFKSVQAAPPDQQRQMIRDFMREHAGNMDNNWRRSPAQRAKRYARVVSNRETAQGKK